MKDIKIVKEDMSLEEVCKEYNIALETVEKLIYDEIDCYCYGKIYDNGKDLFYLSDMNYRCLIIKLTGEKYILNTQEEDFPSEIYYEDYFNNDIILSYDANEDHSLDFLFEFSTERYEGFEKTKF